MQAATLEPSGGEPPRWGRSRPGKPTEFTTTDPAEAHAYMRDVYVDNAMHIRGSAEGFRLRSSHHDAGDFAVSWLSHTMDVEHAAEPLGYVLIGRVLLGRFERETEGETLRAGTDDVFVIAQPDRPYRAAWETMRLQLVRVDLPGFEQKRFSSLEPVTSDAARRLKRTINYSCSAVLGNADAMASPLVVSEAAQMLGAAVLDAFAPDLASAAGDARSSIAALRRAVDFVEQHAHRDIGLVDIAAAAMQAPRATQLAFRRYLGTSPLGYLRRVRLARAHRDLEAADPASGETVAAVGLRWGFLNAGRFAVAYHKAFGISPHDSLHN